MKSVHATADISANSQAVIGMALKQGGYLNLLRKRLKGLRCHHRFLSVFPFDQSELEPSDSSAAFIWLNSLIFLPVSHIVRFRIRFNRSEVIELRSLDLGIRLPIDLVYDIA